MRSRALSLVLAAAALLPGSANAEVSERGEGDPRGCPGHYCRNYNISCPSDQVSRNEPDGRGQRCRPGARLINFEYWINPTNPFGITPNKFRKWIAYGSKTWEYTSPRIRFHFKGFTDRLPVSYDQHNTIGFGAIKAAGMVIDAPLGEWDMLFNIWHPPAWLPCRFKCTPVPVEFIGDLQHPSENRPLKTSGKLEIASVIVHEFGHVLGLHHPEPVDGISPRCVTMHSESCTPYDHGKPQYDRATQSPALAELLAMQQLYPYTCPKPPKHIRNPNKNRNWLPWRYQRVCPTIQVATP